MKALVVRQPWASLIAHGIKTIETRWFAPRTSIEPGDQIAIVAGKRHGLPDYGIVGPYTYFHTMEDSTAQRVTPMGGVYTPQGFDFDARLGSVVAVVTFDEALPVVDEDGDLTTTEPPCLEHRPRGATNSGLWRWMPAWEWVDEIGYEDLTVQLPLGDFTPGRYGWLLSNPQRLAAPVPCPAKRPDGTRTVMQGVFTLPDDVLEQVTPQLAREGSER